MSSENKRPFIRKYVISVNMVAAFPTLKVEDIQRLIERLIPSRNEDGIF